MLYRTLLGIAVFLTRRVPYERLDQRYRALLRYPAYGWPYILSIPTGLLLSAMVFLTVRQAEIAIGLIIACFVAAAIVYSECIRRAEAAFARVPRDDWTVPTTADIRSILSRNADTTPHTSSPSPPATAPRDQLQDGNAP